MITLTLLSLLAATAPGGFRERPIDAADLLTSKQSIEQCYKSIVPSTEKYVVATCKSSWHGITYTLDQRWVFELQLPSDTTDAHWSIMCHEDKVKSLQICSLIYGQNGSYFSVINGPWGDRVYWGKDGYPGTGRVMKFGDEKPIYIPAGRELDRETSTAILEMMRLEPNATFRWYTWPEKLPADIEINLAKFKDINAFFHAAALAYRSR